MELNLHLVQRFSEGSAATESPPGIMRKGGEGVGGGAQGLEMEVFLVDMVEPLRAIENVVGYVVCCFSFVFNLGNSGFCVVCCIEAQSMASFFYHFRLVKSLLVKKSMTGSTFLFISAVKSFLIQR